MFTEKDDDGLAATLNIRLSVRERLQLEQLAARDDRKVTALARHLLRQALANTEQAA
jgi:hypothetical protein